MKDLKVSIEQYVKDNWTESPIFWFGTDFNAKGLTDYVQVKVLPSERNILDSTSCTEELVVFFEVLAYSNNYTETFAILDRFATMMRASSFDFDSETTYEFGYQENNIWFNIWRTNINAYNDL